MLVVRGAIPGPKGGIVYRQEHRQDFSPRRARAAGISFNPQKASARTNPQKASARNK
jgi:large subunit ribosomal protein L3